MRQDTGASLRDRAGGATPLSHSTVSQPEALIPSAAKCECQDRGVLKAGWAGWYDAELELPFVDHEPSECQCTNDLAQYRSSNGEVRWLCSCCHTFRDARICDSDGSGEAGETAQTGSTVGDSAGPKDIAQPKAGDQS